MEIKVSPDILELKPYQPGKPISETKREYGLENVVKLASNESPIGCSPHVIEALQEALVDIHRYPDASCHDLRQALSKYYGVSDSTMVFGNGSNELIDLAIRIFCEPGQKVLTSKAAFIAYKICAQAARVKVIETPLDDELCFQLPLLKAELEKDANKEIRVVFIANPNNPTGTYVGHDSVVEFMEWVNAHRQDTLVVMDEAYCEFVRAEDYPKTLELMRKYSNLVSLRTLSKVYGLAGLRVGVLIAPEEVIDLFNRVRNPFNVNSLAQVAAMAAVEDQEFLQQAQLVNWQGLDYYYQEFKRLGLKYYESQGNFVLFDSERNAGEVTQCLLKKGLIVRPVVGFGLTSEIRISVGLPEENEFAIRCIGEMLNEVKPN